MDDFISIALWAAGFGGPAGLVSYQSSLARTTVYQACVHVERAFSETKEIKYVMIQMNNNA